VRITALQRVALDLAPRHSRRRHDFSQAARDLSYAVIHMGRPNLAAAQLPWSLPLWPPAFSGRPILAQADLAGLRPALIDGAAARLQALNQADSDGRLCLPEVTGDPRGNGSTRETICRFQPDDASTLLSSA